MAESSAPPDALEASATLNDTKGFNETKEMATTLREGMSLIDRFYNGGNRARPEALDILVVVLDSVVQRMREAYSSRKGQIEALDKEKASIESQVDRIKNLQDPLKKELAEKRELAKQLQSAIDHGNEVVQESVDAAREALAKATLAKRTVNTQFAQGMKLNTRGYDGQGRPLPGRETNLRKNPNGPAARKAGDMLKDLPSK